MRTRPVFLGTVGLVLIVTAANSAEPPRRAEPSATRRILAAAEVPWEKLDNGWQRKAVFSGQLTLVLLQVKGPTSGPISLQTHVNDQITYVVEGEIIARVGDETRKIGQGGFFRVPSNAPHGVQILTPSAQLIDVFTPPREDFRKK